MKPKLEEIQDKLNKGEALSDDEKKELMSAPPPQALPAVGTTDENEETTDGKTLEPDKKTSEGKPNGEDTPPKKEPGSESEAGKDTDIEEQMRQDLELPEEQVDMTKYSTREQGLFRALKKERKERKESQRKLDESELAQRQAALKQQQTAGDEEIAAIDAEINALLDGKEEDDFLTAGDMKKMRQLQTKRVQALEKKAATAAPAEIQTETTSKTELENHAFKAYLSDKDPGTFALASENIEALLGEDREAQKKIAEARKNGENPVALAVQFVRNHPKWKEIAAAAKKSAPAGKPVVDENQQRLDRIKNNEGKTRTTGAGGGGADPADEYTLEELAKMDPVEFGKLPASKRQELLKKLGNQTSPV